MSSEKRNNKKIFAITLEGGKYYQKLLLRKSSALPSTFYTKKPANTFIICAFDIPEKESKKRRWLRIALRNLGMKFIQKSVWMGKIKIPEDFLDDIKYLELASYIEIFEITKSGSLHYLQ
jgi:CRISPR/Cas system-associated endoribonuclease Cas2